MFQKKHLIPFIFMVRTRLMTGERELMIGGWELANQIGVKIRHRLSLNTDAMSVLHVPPETLKQKSWLSCKVI